MRESLTRPIPIQPPPTPSASSDSTRVHDEHRSCRATRPVSGRRPRQRAPGRSNVFGHWAVCETSMELGNWHRTDKPLYPSPRPSCEGRLSAYRLAWPHARIQRPPRNFVGAKPMDSTPSADVCEVGPSGERAALLDDDATRPRRHASSREVHEKFMRRPVAEARLTASAAVRTSGVEQVMPTSQARSWSSAACAWSSRPSRRPRAPTQRRPSAAPAPPQRRPSAAPAPPTLPQPSPGRARSHRWMPRADAS